MLNVSKIVMTNLQNIAIVPGKKLPHISLLLYCYTYCALLTSPINIHNFTKYFRSS